MLSLAYNTFFRRFNEPAYGSSVHGLRESCFLETKNEKKLNSFVPLLVCIWVLISEQSSEALTTIPWLTSHTSRNGQKSHFSFKCRDPRHIPKVIWFTIPRWAYSNFKPFSRLKTIILLLYFLEALKKSAFCKTRCNCQAKTLDFLDTKELLIYNKRKDCNAVVEWWRLSGLSLLDVMMVW